MKQIQKYVFLLLTQVINIANSDLASAFYFWSKDIFHSQIISPDRANNSIILICGLMHV